MGICIVFFCGAREQAKGLESMIESQQMRFWDPGHRIEGLDV